MAPLLFSRPRISVTLAEDLVFIHPAAAVHDLPSTETLVNGTVLLSLPNPKAVASVSVDLVGLTDASGGGSWPYETSETMRKTLEIDLKGETLPAGNHPFNFTFILDNRTAPYQRCTYGRTRHSVKASVNWCNTGLFSGSSRTTSDPVALFITANPQPEGSLPQPLDLSLQHFHEDLGPVGVGFASPYFTVASLLNIRFTLLGAPADVSIKSVEGFITQQFTILYDDGAKVASPPPQKHRLAKVDRLRASPMLTVPICTNDCDTQTGQPRFDVTGRLLSEPLLPCSECHGDSSTSPTRTPPCCPPSGDADKLYRDAEPLIGRLEANTSFNYSRTFRVPTDDHIRPTTHEATETRIRVAHKLSVEVKYRVAGSQEDRVLMLSKDVVIASCCCFSDSLYLPAYSRAPVKTTVRPLHLRCYCNYSLKEMVDQDGLALQRAGEIDMPTSEARVLGDERRAQKSPAWGSIALDSGGSGSVGSWPGGSRTGSYQSSVASSSASGTEPSTPI